MKFSCSRCGKRFTTSEEPVSGRMYRIPCRCGSTIIIQIDAAIAVNVAPPPLPTAFLRRTGPPPLPRTLAVPPRGIVRPWPPPEPVQEVAAPPPSAAAPAPHVESTIADDPFARAASAGEARAGPPPCGAVEASAPRLARRDPDALDDDSVEFALVDTPLRRSPPPWIVAAARAGRSLAERAAAIWIAGRWRIRAALAGAPASAPAWRRSRFTTGAAAAVVLGAILIAAVATTFSPAAPPGAEPPIVPLPAHAAYVLPPTSVAARSAPAPAMAARRRAVGPNADATAPSPPQARRTAAVDRASTAVSAGARDAAASDPTPREPAEREKIVAPAGDDGSASVDEAPPPAAAASDAQAAPRPVRETPDEPASDVDSAPVPAPATAPALLERPVLVAESSRDAGRSAVAIPAPEEPSPVTANAASDAPPGAREVLAALRERSAAVEACIADAAQEGAGDLAGRRFRLVIAVDPAGTVSEARVDDPEVQSTPAAACLARVAQALSFPPFEGDQQRVVVPLRYRAPE